MSLDFRTLLQRPSIGILVAFIAAICFAAMGLCVKQTTGGAPAFWVVFVRSLTGALFLSPFILQNLRKLIGRDSIALWIRGFAGSSSSLCYFWNLQRSSVPDAGVLLNLSPLLVILASWYFLGEKLSRKQIVGILVTLFGLGAVGFNPDSYISFPVFLSGILGALFGAVAFTALRRAAHKYSTTLVVWTYMISGCILTALLSGRPLFNWLIEGLGPERTEAHFWALSSGFFGLFGQLFLTLAFFSLEAAVASTLSLTSVLWGAVLEVLLEHRVLGAQSWMAYAIVISGAALLQISTIRKKQAPEVLPNEP